MKILFVRPSLQGIRSADAMEPLVFAVLRGLTPPGDETVLYDERLEEVPVDEPADLVAMTVETFTARRAWQLAHAFRRRGVPVVAGGYHPTFVPEEALEHVDAVVSGDAEGLWPRVVEDARHGRLARRYGPSPPPPLAGVRFDRRVFAGKRYRPVLPVQYGRGCKFNCDFCSIRAFYGRSLRQRPVAEVAEEIRAAGRRTVLLVDDNLFVDTEKARELFEALLPLNVRWGCQVSIDVVRDESLLDLMAASGCISALIGFESLAPASLRQMKKGWNRKWLGYREAISRLKRRGILVYGSFVFGYDHDTVDTFAETARFALDERLFLVNFSALTPTPGSPLYDRLRREGRLLHDRWWLDPGYRYGDATFRPARMTPDELTHGCQAARRAFFGRRSIARRLLDLQTHLRSPARAALYLGANWICRRELSAKLGRPLGRVADALPEAA
jgi:radical SAM superfamily enzyme YgiQ (UPF0313 family)